MYQEAVHLDGTRMVHWRCWHWRARLSKKLEGASYFYSASKLVLNRGLFTELPLAGIGIGLSDTVTLVRVY